MKAVSLEKLLPGDIPAGERVLWHGRPQAFSLARRAFRADFVAGYFVALAAWNTVSGWLDGGAAPAAIACAKTLGIGAAALALIGLLAWLSARTTLYVVTSRRLVMKIGMALPIFLNLPFRSITAASARLFDDGTGDIPVALTPQKRLGYLTLWPHARPFHFGAPEPALRSVANASAVADILRRALTASIEEANPAAVPARPAPTQEPAASSPAPEFVARVAAA